MLKLLWFGILAGGLWGQVNPSIMQKTFSAVGPGTTTVTLQNIGQSTHQVYGRLGACNTATNSAQLTLFGDSSDSLFGGTLGIPLSINTTDSVGFITATASGVYPLLTLRVVVPAGCIFTGYYTGTLFGASIGIQKVEPSRQSTLTFPMPVNGYKTFGDVLGYTVSGAGYVMNPVMIAATTGVGGVPAVGHIAACNDSAAISVTAGATVKIVSGTGVVSQKVRVCGFLVNGSAANTTFAVVEGTLTTTPCDTAAVTKISAINIGAGSLGWGTGLGQVVVADSGKDLCITAATGNVTGTLIYGVW